ncbi:MAG: dihydroorotate dehydrogenase (quinone) [Gammaproteobacteria bacterium CG_4_10_14_0_8_um_filter_38_16]|nr:MAG: dihydroorotate dehydrogenase (quinone) [Gammaproteobacteria bacterium CG_4_10_14_0_8_um_filter_38_16]PJA03041.1 MAG: dihydroorotate dehydrogenase (quinone) [Gammaproteobacteria bacterium CG_4_10_14_0_2_um_filter_38_22]PJB10229.1 MAG: dihydroorotate dehydrogenase (quinone) [Gammaproteobacteria bacterium CG_4_9_14_3_um_filter_38_9]
MLYNLLRQILFLFNPETAHTMAKQLIRLRYANFLYADLEDKKPENSVSLWGLSFSNPVGLAAGWDKDAVCFDALFRMGFGFVEVGTVTPKPQDGNPRPRLFRIPKKQALMNRMGFNNAGIDALVEKLQTRKVPGILGVNIGKNKDTPLEKALDDYQLCLRAVYPYADYIVLNISSPNTLGLRELQNDQYLNQLLQGIRITKKNASAVIDKEVPLLVKTSVDLPQDRYAGFVQTLMDAEIDGVVISNTTVNHESVLSCRYGNEAGGLSGAPLHSRTTQMIASIHQISQGKLPIIGVGGILSGADAIAHYQAGAQLVQIYTGFIYRGPHLIDEILRNFKKLDYNESCA